MDRIEQEYEIIDTSPSYENAIDVTEAYEEKKNTSKAYKKAEKKQNKKLKRGFGCLGYLVSIALALVIGFQVGRSVFLGDDYLVPISQKLSFLNQLVDDMYLHDYDKDKLEDSIYRGFMNGLQDRYTCYYNPEEYQQLKDEDAGNYRGIGITVFQDPATGNVTIESVFKGAPADEAGIQAEDVIVSVDDEEVSGLTLTEVVSRIKRPDTDQTVLKIYRKAESRFLDVTVIKSTIEVETVTYKMMEDHVGYISVTQFMENTDEKFIDALDDLSSQGMTSLIVDLRDNGGGYVDTCLHMLSRIIERDKLLVYTEDKNGKKVEYTSDSDKVFDLPMILLVNENSASASEIFTGCLKDYKKATVIGSTTFGKGVVQSVLPLTDGSAVKITVSEYYTPNGNKVHEKGVEPDVVLDMTAEEVTEATKDSSKDKQLNKALEILKQK